MASFKTNINGKMINVSLTFDDIAHTISVKPLHHWFANSTGYLWLWAPREESWYDANVPGVTGSGTTGYFRGIFWNLNAQQVLSIIPGVTPALVTANDPNSMAIHPHYQILVEDVSGGTVNVQQEDLGSKVEPNQPVTQVFPKKIIRGKGKVGYHDYGQEWQFMYRYEWEDPTDGRHYVDTIMSEVGLPLIDQAMWNNGFPQSQGRCSGYVHPMFNIPMTMNWTQSSGLTISAQDNTDYGKNCRHEIDLTGDRLPQGPQHIPSQHSKWGGHTNWWGTKGPNKLGQIGAPSDYPQAHDSHKETGTDDGFYFSSFPAPSGIDPLPITQAIGSGGHLYSDFGTMHTSAFHYSNWFSAGPGNTSTGINFMTTPYKLFGLYGPSITSSAFLSSVPSAPSFQNIIDETHNPWGVKFIEYEARIRRYDSNTHTLLNVQTVNSFANMNAISFDGKAPQSAMHWLPPGGGIFKSRVTATIKRSSALRIQGSPKPLLNNSNTGTIFMQNPSSTNTNWWHYGSGGKEIRGGMGCISRFMGSGKITAHFGRDIDPSSGGKYIVKPGEDSWKWDGFDGNGHNTGNVVLLSAPSCGHLTRNWIGDPVYTGAGTGGSGHSNNWNAQHVNHNRMYIFPYAGSGVWGASNPNSGKQYFAYWMLTNHKKAEHIRCLPHHLELDSPSYFHYIDLSDAEIDEDAGTGLLNGWSCDDLDNQCMPIYSPFQGAYATKADCIASGCTGQGGGGSSS